MLRGSTRLAALRQPPLPAALLETTLTPFRMNTEHPMKDANPERASRAKGTPTITKSCAMNTCINPARNPFRMNTSKNPYLQLLYNEHLQKTGGGRGVMVNLAPGEDASPACPALGGRRGIQSFDADFQHIVSAHTGWTARILFGRGLANVFGSLSGLAGRSGEISLDLFQRPALRFRKEKGNGGEIEDGESGEPEKHHGVAVAAHRR
jgi:hypothetical protein